MTSPMATQPVSQPTAPMATAPQGMASDIDLGNDPFMTHNPGNTAVRTLAPTPTAAAPAGATATYGAPAPPVHGTNLLPPGPMAYAQPDAARNPEWYMGDNNWNMCLEKMDMSFKQIREEFTGAKTEVQRLVQQTGRERMLDMAHKNSGGRAGSQYQAKTRTSTLSDVFYDYHFPPSNLYWFKCSPDEQDGSEKPPYQWGRLMSKTIGWPYPRYDAYAGASAPRPGRVYQGQIEDFYLVQAMQILSMKPELVWNIFADMEFSNPDLGVFIIRLYKHAQWLHVVLDDSYPQSKEGDPLWSTSEFWPTYAWPGLIEKAYAKMHGSWEGVGGGGHVEEALTDLTGGCASRFATTDVAPDRLWQYIKEMMPIAVFGCSINEKECSKRTIPLKKIWSCSIYDTHMVDDVPYICVCCSAPSLAVKHLPLCEIETSHGLGEAEGFAWLRIDDFVQLFEHVYECRLTNPMGPRGHPVWNMGHQSLLSGGMGGMGGMDPMAMQAMQNGVGGMGGMHGGMNPMMGGMHGGMNPMMGGMHGGMMGGMMGGGMMGGQHPLSFQEQLWAIQDVVTAETAPSFMFEVRTVPMEITMEISQTDYRFSEPHKKNYAARENIEQPAPTAARAEQAALLLRFFQCSAEVDEHRGGEVYMIHMSAWGHCRDAMCCVKIFKPGKYLAMVSLPAKYECDKMLFRVYSRGDPRMSMHTTPHQPPTVTPLTGHRSFVAVNQTFPLDGIPYSLVGFPFIRHTSERLPQMFEEDEGKGKPLTGWRKKKQDIFSTVIAGVKEKTEDAGQTIGYFGGTGAGTMRASEYDAPQSCSVM